MSPELDLKVLQTFSELEEFRSAWDNWPGHRDSQIDFHTRICKSSPAIIRPHVLVAHRKGTPIAMLVGRVEKTCLSFALGYLKVRLDARLLYFVAGAFRGESSPDICRLFVNRICRDLSSGSADAAYLNSLELESTLYKEARSWPRFLMRDHFCSAQWHYRAQSHSAPGGFFGSLSPKHRKTLKWQEKRLLKDFESAVVIKCYRDVSELDLAMEAVETVAKAAYQRGLGVGFSQTPNALDRLRWVSQNGWLRVYVLYIQGVPGAFWIGDRNSTTFYSDYMGYDQRFARYSPGMFLITRVLQDLSTTDPGLTEIDFGPGHAQYKDVLGTIRIREAPVYIFAPSLAGFRLLFVRSVVGAIDASMKYVLQRLGLLGTLKKRWRDRVRPPNAKPAQEHSTSIAARNRN